MAGGFGPLESDLPRRAAWLNAPAPKNVPLPNVPPEQPEPGIAGLSPGDSFVKRLFGAALLIVGAACSGKKNTALPVTTATVQRRDIVIDAQASGAIEPINVVEVKSKAGGVITRLPVETGTMVKRGDLLVQVDTRDVNNQLEQAQADLDAAKEKYDVSQ